MLPAFCFAAAVAVGPVVPDAPTRPELQWAAVAACARVGGGPDGGSVATAVCVGQRDGSAYLLTALHVVPKGEVRVYEFFARESYPKPARSLTRGEVVVQSAAADLALVKLPVGDEPLPAVRLSGPGDRPKRLPFRAVAVGCPDASAPVCRVEKLLEKKFVRRTGGGVAFFWQAATPAVGGMSGGPLLADDGEVIGLCSATQGGATYFTHLDEILFALKQGGYGWLFEG